MARTSTATSTATRRSGGSAAATGPTLSQQAFLTLVYAIVLAQVLLTLAVMYYMRAAGAKVGDAAFIGLVVASILLAMAASGVFLPLPTWVRMALLTLLSLVLGALLHRVASRSEERVVFLAVAGTAGVFVALSLLGWLLTALHVDLAGWAMYLSAAFLAIFVAWLTLLVSSLAGFQGETMKLAWKVLLYAIIVVSALYIVFATNMVLEGRYMGDYVLAALDLYTSFVNVLSAWLGLAAEE